MSKKQFSMPKWRCLRCGNEWLPQKDGKPQTCSKCRSPYWDRPRRVEIEKKAQELEALIGPVKWSTALNPASTQVIFTSEKYGALIVWNIDLFRNPGITTPFELRDDKGKLINSFDTWQAVLGVLGGHID